MNNPSTLTPIEFWFDFTSPYAYLMSEKIEALAEKYGRTINWCPMLLGAIFREIGGQPLLDTPLKGEYSRYDIVRSARFLGVTYRHPDPFPLGFIQAARATLFLKTHHPERVADWIHGVFRAYFQENTALLDAPSLQQLAVNLRFSDALQQSLIAAIQADTWKNALREAGQSALALGIFGAPFVRVAGEPFWGVDRLPQLERWLQDGKF